jgi:rfaE bifunctional protein nucleotidyltransferase chain/domain
MNKFSGHIEYEIKEILGLTQKWKSENQSIVFTNGCFDILHAGHVDYLQKAASLGDRLIVGLNSDDSVSRLKGPDRPINSQKHRATLLAALRCVDAVIVFSEDTPLQLITELLPHILVKGGDYKGKEVVGESVVTSKGGKLVLIDFVYNTSTSKIQERIKNSTA